MDKYSVLQPLFDRYNKTPDDPSFSTTQKFVLDKMRDIQAQTREANKQIQEEAKKIDEANKHIEEIRFKVVNLDGQNQSYLDMLLKLVEESNG